jgi:hypothetical protein
VAIAVGIHDKNSKYPVVERLILDVPENRLKEQGLPVLYEIKKLPEATLRCHGKKAHKSQSPKRSQPRKRKAKK